MALNMSTNHGDAPVHASAFGCITVPFLLIALVPLAWGARANWLNGQLARDGDVVTGRVVELRYEPANGSVVRQPTRGGSARGTSPVVTFTTRSGEERTVVGSVNRLPAPWVVGQAVDVVYDPVNPGRADLRTEIAGWRVWFAIWCAVATLLAVIALLPVALLIRQRRAQRGSPG
ncbi:MAG TPA: DUF3592 domain-containing protein [Vicinamibacteria bacterium]|nr:DUF3592 domain-containing protein [Vicinamibacteria bacterium]